MPDNNGTKPQIQKRVRWVALPEEYDGFKFEVWVNAPARLWTSITSAETDEAEKMAALGRIVTNHNGWLDFDGQEYPPPSDPAFWEDIPTELAACMVVTVQNEMGKLPNSLAPRRRR